MSWQRYPASQLYVKKVLISSLYLLNDNKRDCRVHKRLLCDDNQDLDRIDELYFSRELAYKQ